MIFLILGIIIPVPVLLFGWRSLVLRIIDRRRRQQAFTASIVLLTLTYWTWESRAGGNIRVDLLLIYPTLFLAYILFLWDRLKWLSIVVSLLLMTINYGFFAMSYLWFHKYPG